MARSSHRICWGPLVGDRDPGLVCVCSAQDLTWFMMLCLQLCRVTYEDMVPFFGHPVIQASKGIFCDIAKQWKCLRVYAYYVGNYGIFFSEILLARQRACLVWNNFGVTLSSIGWGTDTLVHSDYSILPSTLKNVMFTLFFYCCSYCLILFLVSFSAFAFALD
jgi:hypothetical protein